MKYQPKFKIADPMTKEENLICELSRLLHDTQKVFINLNKASYTNNEIFITLRDGTLAFAGQSIEALLNLMVDKEQKLFFLKECQDIFNCYIQQASENIK